MKELKHDRRIWTVWWAEEVFKKTCPRRWHLSGNLNGEKDQTVQRSVGRSPRSGRAGVPRRQEHDDKRKGLSCRGRWGFDPVEALRFGFSFQCNGDPFEVVCRKWKNLFYVFRESWSVWQIDCPRTRMLARKLCKCYWREGSRREMIAAWGGRSPWKLGACWSGSSEAGAKMGYTGQGLFF